MQRFRVFNLHIFSECRLIDCWFCANGKLLKLLLNSYAKVVQEISFVGCVWECVCVVVGQFPKALSCNANKKQLIWHVRS